MKVLILVVIGFVSVYSADGFNLFGREENTESNELSVGYAHRVKPTTAPEVITTKKAAQKKTKATKKPSAKKPYKKPGKNSSSKKNGKKGPKKNSKKNKKNKTVKPVVIKQDNTLQTPSL